MSDFNFSCICHAIIFNRYSRILICRYNKRRTIIMRSPSHRLTVTVTVIICTICRPLNCIINYTHINLLFNMYTFFTILLWWYSSAHHVTSFYCIEKAPRKVLNSNLYILSCWIETFLHKSHCIFKTHNKSATLTFTFG